MKRIWLGCPADNLTADDLAGPRRKRWLLKRVITIVGGGQSGLQLGNGLLPAGYDVRLVQDRKGDDIRTGKVMSSQCMFDKALSYERELGLNFWDKECPTVNSISFTVPAPDGSGNKAIDWNGNARQARASRRPTREISALDAGIRKARRHRSNTRRPAPPTSKNMPRNPTSSSSRPARATSPGCSNATRKNASSTRRSARSRSPTSRD